MRPCRPRTTSATADSAAGPAAAKRRYLAAMVLFPLALLWLIVVAVWVYRHSQSTPPEDQVWRRWRPRPRAPRDGEPTAGRARARRASKTAR